MSKHSYSIEIIEALLTHKKDKTKMNITELRIKVASEN